jgi:hypothetical protein
MHSYKTQINSKDTSYYESVINEFWVNILLIFYLDNV